MTPRPIVPAIALAAFAGLAAALTAGNAQAQTIVRISQRLDGGTTLVQANNASSNPQISSNGANVFFISSASNLAITGPIVQSSEVWAHFGNANACSLETQTGNEDPPLSNPRGINGTCRDLSYRGGSFYYTNTANNGTFGCTDGNNFDDIYSGISYFSGFNTNPCDTQGNNDSAKANVSQDGTKVAYETLATNLLGPANPTNGFRHIIVNTIASDANSLKSVTGTVLTGITEANGNSFAPSLNGDGTVCVYASDATNLASGGNGGFRQIYARYATVIIVSTEATQRISNAVGGGPANGACNDPSISNDGRWVAYSSAADNLVTGVSSSVNQIFLYDRTNAVTEHVSRSSVGAIANGACSKPIVSGNGRFVTFVSSATNLVSGDSGAIGKVYVYDRIGGSLRRVSNNTSGGAPDGASDNPSISDSGLAIAFDSLATDLVTTDTNGDRDVFVATYPGTPPTNDVCSKAVTVLDGLHNFDTTDADTTLIGAESCSPNRTIYHDVWYRYVAHRTGNVTITTQNLTSLDTILAIYSSCPTASGGAIICNDDTAPGFQSRVVFAAVNGADYYIRLGNFSNNTVTGGSGGTGQFLITSCPADVAQLGGSPGADGQLTADDLVFFLQQFFANNLAVCDIALLGGSPGSDGQITADDLVYFLSLFFNNCA